MICVVDAHEEGVSITSVVVARLYRPSVVGREEKLVATVWLKKSL
jgi:hypothetical protein